MISAAITIEGANNVQAKVPALFTFGDSIFDPGNNDFIPTSVRANNPPYGQDFMGGKPTGRFSNGKLSADFICMYGTHLVSSFHNFFLTFIPCFHKHFDVKLKGWV